MQTCRMSPGIRSPLAWSDCHQTCPTLTIFLCALALVHFWVLVRLVEVLRLKIQIFADFIEV